MRTGYARLFLALVLWGTWCLPALNVSARLPRPVRAGGIAMAVDFDTHTMAFKQNRGGKLLLLDWDQRTKFIRDGKSTPAAELSPGKEVVVVYRYISFHNPTLLEVSWAGGK